MSHVKSGTFVVHRSKFGQMPSVQNGSCVPLSCSPFIVNSDVTFFCGRIDDDDDELEELDVIKKSAYTYNII